MADILIRGIDAPESCLECVMTYSFFRNLHCNKLEGMSGFVGPLPHANDRHPDCPIVPLPEGHGDLIERKALNLFLDYKEVRNGIKQTIKATERDGRTTTGITIELLKQTLVALDSLRSVRRYFLNAKTIVPAEGGGADGDTA